MIVLCFPLVSETGNMNAYKDKKKHVACQEFIYRVQIAYKNWGKQFEELQEMYNKIMWVSRSILWYFIICL